jgi:hypothetical protein
VGIANKQVKANFDTDNQDVKNKGFDSAIINNIIEDIQINYNNDIYISSRDPRDIDMRIHGEYTKVKKHSYRLFSKSRITYFNIPIVFRGVFNKYEISIRAFIMLIGF